MLAAASVLGQDRLTMQTKLSSKGQVVLPGQLRRRLGLHAGDPLDANIEGGRIVLTPRKKRRLHVKIVTDAVSGLPVLSAGSDAPVLSSKEVDEILATFP
jgi:AbrB family looped-hinge helix DNA binding protein